MKATIFLVLVSLVAACGTTSNTNRSSSNANAEVKKGVTPVADSEVAVIEMENPAAYGTIKLELYSNVAPKAVARFRELAKEGFYDGVEFHRINQSVIQGGDPLSKSSAAVSSDPTKVVGSGSSDKPNVPAEFSDIPYDTGIVGAARSGNDVNSANSQFFITLKREQGFDNNYTIFGKVIEGMNNVRTISGVQPKDGDRPLEPVRIKTIRIEPKP